MCFWFSLFLKQGEKQVDFQELERFQQRKTSERAVASQLQSSEFSPSVGREEVGKTRDKGEQRMYSLLLCNNHALHASSSLDPAATSG